VVTNLILVAVSGTYLAAKPGTYRKGLMTLLPDSAQDAAGAFLDRASAALRGWLKAQAISMALVGVLSGLGLWLAGVPSPVALGLLAGLAEFIPLAGPPLAAIPAVLMGLTVGTATAGWSLVVFVIVQQLESNAITPLVQKKVIDIPPLVTLFALAFAGLLFGALGVVLAGPLTVLIFVAVRELYVRRILKRDAGGGSAEPA
jgi:predicted PurR-regulated permease PerM